VTFRAFSVPIESEWRLSFFVLTRFLDANRYPSRIKSGAGFRWKTLWPHHIEKPGRNQSPELEPSFRGDAQHRTRNLEIPGLVLTHHPGMTSVAPNLQAIRRPILCFEPGLPKTVRNK
jgi:hypothetical protein